MHYAEEKRGQRLYYKNSPKGEWIEFTKTMLVIRIDQLERRLLEELNVNQGDSK